MRRFEISFTDELHARAKKAAAAQGVTMLGLIRQALIKYLESIGK